VITIEAELDRLLAMLADHVDLRHCAEVDARYRAALRGEEVDHAPLVVQADFGDVLRLPPPWDAFRRYSYRETFQHPAAMMQNMLLDRVVPGVLLKDDNPLAIRAVRGDCDSCRVMSSLRGLCAQVDGPER
jgi:hypothetical protein